MKIAFLIAAHTDPIHLQRLIDSLNMGDNTEFYIHLDRRADIIQFNSLKGNVRIIPERYLIQWGGFSQCRYQKALIKACIESNVNYDRIFFLSGLDYPLWSNQRIVEYLLSDPLKEYICGMDITESDGSIDTKRIELYHFFRDIPVKNGKIKRLFSGTSRKIMEFLPIRKPKYIIDEGKRLHIYHGSSWWCLTMECLKYVYEHISEPIEKYFKTSFAPDEMMIQTIVFNSKFGERAILHKGQYPDLVGLTPLHHIDYQKSVKIFTEKDFEELKSIDKMFFRKAVTGRSDKLLNIVDAYRN